MLSIVAASLALPWSHVPALAPDNVREERVYISESKIPGAGRGVFAARAFEPCDLIEASPAIQLTSAEYPVGALRQYLFSSLRTDNSTVVVLGHGSLFNHGGVQASVGYRPSAEGADTFEFYALRPIAAGEELLIHYGYEPHPVRHLEVDNEADDDAADGVSEETRSKKAWMQKKAFPAKKVMPSPSPPPVKKIMPSPSPPPEMLKKMFPPKVMPPALAPSPPPPPPRLLKKMFPGKVFPPKALPAPDLPEPSPEPEPSPSPEAEVASGDETEEPLPLDPFAKIMPPMMAKIMPTAPPPSPMMAKVMPPSPPPMVAKKKMFPGKKSKSWSSPTCEELNW